MSSSPLASLGLLVLRVGFGGLIAVGHGWDKLSNFSSLAKEFPDPLGIGQQLSLALATGAEFFCAIAVALGLLTRLAVLPLITTMAIAAFVIHSADPLATKEKALLYLVAFVTLFFTGGGGFSLDAVLLRRRKSTS